MLLEKKINTLQGIIIQMASTNQSTFRAVGEAFLKKDPALAEQIENSSFSFEDFEDEVFKVLALQHPIASDLRKVIRIFKVGQDLDLLHTYIQKAAKKTRKITSGSQVTSPQQFPHQLNVVNEMLDELCKLVQSGADGEPEAPFKKLEQECHQLKKDIVSELEKQLQTDKCDTKQILLEQGVSRNLDRIAKIIVNIAEY